MSIQTIRGMVLPAFKDEEKDDEHALEHTYVSCDDGRAWGCHGRKTGGAEICNGTGEADQSACLAGPDETAGIKYLLTGVCHQAANRILYPCGKQITNAKGYPMTVFTFGAYGLVPGSTKRYSPRNTPWPELVTCQNDHNH